MFIRLFFAYLLFVVAALECRLPELSSANVTEILNDIMKAHASYKSLNTELVARSLKNYIDNLDPNKTYFIESDIHQWLNPSDALLEQVLEDYQHSRFPVFEQIQNVMVKAIYRRRELEKKINLKELPTHVSAKEFKHMQWATNEEELLNRLMKLKALQIEASTKLNEDVKDKALERIAKIQLKYENEILNQDPIQHERLLLSNVLKATAAAFDSQTAYFTPDEAAQFMVSLQQRIRGIGAQLRDDLNGYTVTKIIEGSPAALGKELKVKDRIIAVNGEPVVGMDITEGVGLIRGEIGTKVTLTVIRETKVDGKTKDETLDIVVPRGDVIFTEARYEVAYEPLGNGIIAYLRLHTFYQDADSSSAADLEKAINQLKKEHKVEGLILDLRYNTGGLLAQAVDVAGLFITKGIVVSIKDSTGAVQHLRDTDGKVTWDGPMLVLVNHASASASEIVAQALQDYGRALVVGDAYTYGKGSFQTFTLSTNEGAKINPHGEYKVTRGRYYTVSGKTPQLTGVKSDIEVPGPLSELEIGEKFAKYPLANDTIKENFDDDLSDIPFTQRNKVRLLYKFDLQPRLHTYEPYLATLKANSSYRIEHNKDYQNLLKEIKKEDGELSAEEVQEPIGQNDLQLNEAFSIMKDLIILMHYAGKN